MCIVAVNKKDKKLEIIKINKSKMSQKNQSKKESDLAERIGELQEKREEIEREIQSLKNQGEIAPDGAWIVRYRARGQGGTYWYYKWQSKQAIFITKKGNNSCHKYIGKAGSSAFMKAVEIMQRITKVEALQQVQYTLDLGLIDLIEESTRIKKNNDQEKGKSTC
jgi:hypothetical protein